MHIPFLDVLQQKSRLPYAARSFQAHQSGIPIDILIEISLEIQGRFGDLVFRNPIDLFDVRVFYHGATKVLKPSFLIVMVVLKPSRQAIQLGAKP